MGWESIFLGVVSYFTTVRLFYIEIRFTFVESELWKVRRRFFDYK